MIKSLTTILTTVILGGILAIGGWWTLFLREQFGRHDREMLENKEQIELLSDELELKSETIETLEVVNDQLELTVEERDARIRQLDTAIRLLKVDHRLAHLKVLAQTPSPDDPSRVRTRVVFTELGPDQEPLGPGREIEVEGRLIYVDTLVVKFGDDFVENGDALRGTSVCLFRRLFGENQSPSEGVALEGAGTQPLTYAEDVAPNPLYDDLWERVWDYANDPELARGKGVRASHGEAPFIEARPGKTYLLELRASGGLTIRNDP